MKLRISKQLFEDFTVRLERQDRGELEWCAIEQGISPSTLVHM